MKHFLRSIILSTFITIAPLNALAYNAQAQANAAKYGSPSSIDWSNAISIAEKLDKKEGIGCFK
jgi:hypothetical protein